MVTYSEAEISCVFGYCKLARWREMNLAKHVYGTVPDNLAYQDYGLEVWITECLDIIKVDKYQLIFLKTTLCVYSAFMSLEESSTATYLLHYYVLCYVFAHL